MGSGSYSSIDRIYRAKVSGFYTDRPEDIFKNRKLDDSMNPFRISVRESRDSVEHPNSFAIVLALDVTGSMGKIPHDLVKDGFPSIMDNIMRGGILDPQVLFLGIGDHECDDAPLQVGQFESNDQLLDKWLTNIWIEHGGGGNNGESYSLAWYFAAAHTAIDCYEKRAIKGVLFTIGDEPVLPRIPSSVIKKIMDNSSGEVFTKESLLASAREKYNVFHVHVREGQNGMRQSVIDGWFDLLGEDLIIADNYMDIPNIISSKIVENSALVVETEGRIQREIDM